MINTRNSLAVSSGATDLCKHKYHFSVMSESLHTCRFRIIY